MILLLIMVGMVACDEPTTYSVTISESAHGVVTASHTEAAEGTKITLTVTPDDGYKAYYVKADGVALTVTDGTAEFDMPDHEVTVEAAFVVDDGEPTPPYGEYGISVATDIVGGKITADKSSAPSGATVTLTVAERYGYELTSLKANQTDVSVSQGVYSFTMPEENVVINAVFSIASNAVNQAAPLNAYSISSTAVAGAEAVAKFNLSYETDGVRFTAYVQDSAITDYDGLSVYFGINEYASSALVENNKGVVATIGGTTVYGVDNGEYVAIEASVDSGVLPWAIDGVVLGYVVDISASYDFLGVSSDEALGNITVLPVLTNCDKSNYSNKTIYGNADIDNADTYALVNEDATLSDNYYKFGAGQLGRGNTAIATGQYWDLSEDYGKNSADYADRKAVLNGHDGNDNNLVMYRSSGKNLYAKATLSLTGLASSDERWGKFGIMLFNGASQRGFFFYVDAYIGDGGEVSFDNINGTSLGYNSAPTGWGSWVTISNTSGYFDLDTKTITLGLTAYDGMIYMYYGDTLVGETTFDAGDDAVIGFKSFGYTMEVTDYSVTDDLNDPDFIAHRKEIVNQELDVLFLGDSYMDFWTWSGFAQHTAAIPNKADIGVGGTQINYWTEKVDFVKKCYSPDKFVFHIGVNDIDDGNTTAATAFARLQTMVDVYQEAFPEADIYWVSLVHNTMFAHKCSEYDSMNALVREYAEGNEKLHYIDVSSVGVDADGNTRVNMFYDGLHFNAEYGYPLWSKLILEAIGYGERSEGTTLGDIDDIYAYNNWTFSDDGETAYSRASGEQAIYALDMDYSSDFIFTVDVKSESVLAGDAWSKVGLMLRNDNYTIFGYVDTPTSTEVSNRKWCSIVYRKNGYNTSNVFTTVDWDWSDTGTISAADRLIESEFITLGIAKIGGSVYMLADGKVVSYNSIPDIASQSFVAGVLVFNRTVDAKNAQLVTGTQNELLTQLGLDAKLDGVADDAIWTTEVIANTVSNLGRKDDSYYNLAAVKGSDGVYFLATIYHKQALTQVAQGDGSGWYHWLNLEFRWGNADGVQSALYFKNGNFKAFGGIVVGGYVTEAPEEEGGLNKTTVEFWVPYMYFSGYTSESEEIRVNILGWVAENGWTATASVPTVSSHGLRFEHNINVTETNGVTVDVASKACKGDEISFTVVLAEGLDLNEVKVGNDVLESVEGVYSFVMPDSDVTITVTIEGKRTVSLGEYGNLIGVSNNSPDQFSEITFSGIAPYVLTKLYVNDSEIAVEEGVASYTVGADDITVTGIEYKVVTDGIAIDGELETELYGEAFSFKVEDNRNVTLYATKTSHGVVMYLIAYTNANVDTASDWWMNHNFEFYLNNGAQSYVNSKDESSNVTAFSRSATLMGAGSGYEGKYRHIYEVFVAGDFSEDVQLNYAFKAPTEVARYEGLSNPQWDRSDWWCPIIGGADTAKYGLLGYGQSRQANLFITDDGLETNRPVAANGTIDGNLSEYSELTSVTKGNENALFTFSGYTAADGYYLGITILQKSRAAATAEWHLNDNVEIYLFDQYIGFSIFDDFVCAHGAITQYAMVRTETPDGDYKYKTEIELFIYNDTPGTAAFFRFGCNGNGFGGWQALVWDGADRIKISATGAEFVNYGYDQHALNADGITLDGNLNEDFWSGVTVWENTGCTSYSSNGVYAKVQARKGAAGVYLAVTMYHHTAYNVAVKGDGSDWYQYLNIEFRFVVNNNWDASAQRAVCPWNNGAANCAFGWTSVANEDEGLSSYAHKTVFEIFTPYEWGIGSNFAIKKDIPLWIACVAETDFTFLLDFNQDTTLPTVVGNDGFVRR